MYTYKYPHPALTVDNVILAQENNEWHVLLIRRKHEPYKNLWALPGGYVDKNELIEKAALRELKEETGITDIVLKFLGYFDVPDRDPREWTISMAFVGFASLNIKIKAASDAIKAEWFKINSLPQLAFDHADILESAKSMLEK